jgi:ribosomal protein L11 methyltransferase
MIQISITTDRAHLDRVEKAFLDHGAQSVTLRDAADQPVLEPLPGEIPLWPQVVVSGLFSDGTDADPLRQALDEILMDGARFKFETVVERDWTRVWLDDTKPLRVGRRLRICPGGHSEPDPTAIDIRLDPGLAFGTGTHPTTALCLEWLDANPPFDADVIDYGCGSGVLAIAAIKLGARRVRAVDIDPQGLSATRDNAARNGISGLRIVACHPDDLPHAQANLLIANILARPLIELAARFAGRVKSGGKLVMSGVLASQAGQVSTAYAPWFDLNQTRGKEGWALLEGARL